MGKKRGKKGTEGEGGVRRGKKEGRKEQREENERRAGECKMDSE